MKIAYRIRWGHDRVRVLKGHTKRAARRQRAYDRGGSLPGTKPNPPRAIVETAQASAKAKAVESEGSPA